MTRSWTRETEENLVALLDRQHTDTAAVSAHFRANHGAGGVPETALPIRRVECVYFVAACGRIKIGKTDRIRARLDGILAPERPLVLALQPGYTEAEAELHRRFAHLRAYGEWFMPGTDLVAHVIQERSRGPWWMTAPAPRLRRRKFVAASPGQLAEADLEEQRYKAALTRSGEH